MNQMSIKLNTENPSYEWVVFQGKSFSVTVKGWGCEGSSMKQPPQAVKTLTDIFIKFLLKEYSHESFPKITKH